MSILLNKWRGIGTRLYVALGFAVVLTLISSAVGVYHFERSGDLNYRAESESVPALEASWAAAREAERLRALGLQLTTTTGPEVQELRLSAESTMARLGDSLAVARSVPELDADALAVWDKANGLAFAIENLAVSRLTSRQAHDATASLRQATESIPDRVEPPADYLLLLDEMLRAEDGATLDALWEEDLNALNARAPLQPSLIAAAETVFSARHQQLALQLPDLERVAAVGSAGTLLEVSVSILLERASSHNAEAVGLTVLSFDQGRVWLAVISIVSVAAATLASWLWVGNAVVRRLSHLSERMRNMAGGDLETPVPEVGRDEIGQLAEALEHFRQQALEVQRLNLVEQLYGELREANVELQRMQARLVAQEKLVAVGELVSGVAHEMSNPLNFVKNFSEGSLELCGELKEMLDDYRDRMSEKDASLLDELTEEITGNLNRVASNGARALAIVERMRGLGLEGGDLVLIDLNASLRQAAQHALEAFRFQWEDFQTELVFDLDDSVGEQMVAVHYFGDAVSNLVSNACFAMRAKQLDLGPGYLPHLTVSSRVHGGMVEIRLRDNGTGIAEDIVDRIFNPFFTTSEGTSGSGLGLTLAADIARRHGGDLVVDTVFGEYAQFTMSLPALTKAEEEGHSGEEGCTVV